MAQAPGPRLDGSGDLGRGRTALGKRDEPEDATP